MFMATATIGAFKFLVELLIYRLAARNDIGIFALAHHLRFVHPLHIASMHLRRTWMAQQFENLVEFRGDIIELGRERTDRWLKDIDARPGGVESRIYKRNVCP